MIFRYDLSRQIAGYDFFHWLIYVQMMGATGIVIDTSNVRASKWSMHTTMRRVKSIILPGPALAGLPCRLGRDGKTCDGYLRAFLDLAKARPTFRRLKSVLPAGKDRYTVTIRNTERATHRNSNEQAWRTFAADIGARVIEDYEVQPIELHELMAIYAGAEMNFGVSNGPVTLGLLSEYPMMAFDFAKSARALENIGGMKFGDQLPWATKDQFQIWEADDLDVIRKHFNSWRARETASRNLAA